MRIASILAVLALAVAGCSSSTSKPPAPAAAGSSPAPPASASSPAAAPPATTAAAKLKVGGTATLTTPSGPLEITLVKIVDPASAEKSGRRPAAGEKYVAVQFKFVNKGTMLVTDDFHGIRAADGQDQPVNVQADVETDAGATIDVFQGLKLAQGDTTLGYITFHMPTSTKIVRIQYTLSGGGTAEWTLN